MLFFNNKNNKILKKIYKQNKKINKEYDDNIIENNLKIDDNKYENIKLNIIRDNLVLKDKLYPPLNRQPLTDNINIFNNYTRDSYDTYHLVGNLTRLSDNFQMLLFGRLKCRGCQSEFYASPADKNLSSIKIKLDNIKDIYNLPNEINIDDIYPGKYKLIELKYPDNQTIYY